VNGATIRCGECQREVDELESAAEHWVFSSDGHDLVPYCPKLAAGVRRRGDRVGAARASARDAQRPLSVEAETRERRPPNPPHEVTLVSGCVTGESRLGLTRKVINRSLRANRPLGKGGPDPVLRVLLRAPADARPTLPR